MRILLLSALAGIAAAPQDAKGAPPPRTRAEVEAVLGPAAAPAKDPRPLNVLLVACVKDHGPGEHDYPAWQKKWAPLLAKVPGVKVDTADPWPSKDQWASADLAVLYLWGRYTDEHFKDLDAHLARGRGLVAAHSATIPVGDTHEKLAARIGMSWKHKATKFRHGALDLIVKQGDGSGITAGFPEQVKLVDESYWPMTAGDSARIRILASGVEEGAEQPLLWTFAPERGRVFTCILGHYSWTFDDPLFRILLLRGMAWAAGEPVDRFRALVLDGVPLK